MTSTPGLRHKEGPQEQPMPGTELRRDSGTFVEVLPTRTFGDPGVGVIATPARPASVPPGSSAFDIPGVPRTVKQRNFPRFCHDLRKVLFGLMLTSWPVYQGKSHFFPSQAVHLVCSAMRTMLAATHTAPRRLHIQIAYL